MNAAEVAVLVVGDPTDEAKAAELVEALQPHLAKPLRKASSPAEAEVAAGDSQVALVLVSEELEKNEALIEAVARRRPNALVPVIVDAKMVRRQKAWRGQLSWSMANELYFDLHEPDLFEMTDLVGKIQAKANGERPTQVWDVFLSHEWGVHSKAKEIAERLEHDYSFKVWLDEKEVSGSIDKSMSHGIEGSKVFVVLATKRYMKKVNDGDRADNCLKEFCHAGNQRSDRIVVAALETEMSKAATVWRGRFHLALALQTPVDVCSISDAAIDRLAEAIRQRINKPEASSYLTPLMRDIFPRLNPCSSEAWAQGKAANFTVGTRSWILEKVGDWHKGKSPVIVLVGDGGVGKSVIMAELCSRGGALTVEGIKTDGGAEESRADLLRCSDNTERPTISVAAYHFFRHDESTAASPKETLVSIAWQLCKSVAGFAEELEQVSLDLLRDKTLADIFRSLLVGPLQKLGLNHARQVVVLDALDECKESDALLDKVIRAWKEAMPPWLSLVVSTRPEGDIIRGLDNNRLDRTVLELKDEENFRDIELHVEHLLQDMSDVVEQKDVKASAQTLAKRSEGLFLWASFLPETLRDAREAKGDGSLLTKEDIEKEDVIPAGLGGMFKEYFGRLRDKVGGPEPYELLLAPIVAAREPLGLKQLTVLLSRRERQTKKIVGDARNLLYQGGDGRVALIHKRMADWLVDDDLSGDLGVDVEEGHKRMAAYCRNHDADDGFRMSHAVYHHVRSGDKAGAFDLLNDFSWVQKLVSFGVDQIQRRDVTCALLRDCAELGITFAPETDTPQLLSKSLKALSWDPNELASEVLARLRTQDDDRDHPLVKSLCEPSEPWLRPVRPTLPHPHDPLQHVLEGHSGEVTSVAVKDDCVVSGSKDYTVRIWNAATGALQHVLEGHIREVTSVAVDGNRVASGSGDKTVRIWNATTGALLHVLEGHSFNVTSVAVEGNCVVSGSRDDTVRIWDAATGALQHVLEGHSDVVTSVAMEGDLVVSGSADKSIRIWNAPSGTLQHVLEGHSELVASVAVEADRVVSGSRDNTIRIWNAATGALQHVLEGLIGEIMSVAVNGNRVVTGSGDKTVRIFNATTGALLHVLEGHSGEVTSVAVEGDRVVSGSSYKSIRIWKVAKGTLQHALEGHSRGVTSVAVEGNCAVSGSSDRTVCVWNFKTGALQQVLRGHSGPVFSVAVEGDRVVSGSDDKTVRIWTASLGIAHLVLEGHSDAVRSVAVEGHRLVSGSWDSTVRVWNATTGALQHVLEGHSSKVSSVAVDGNHVVSGSWDKTVRIWNAETGVVQHVFVGHLEIVTSVAVKGGRLVSGSRDKTIRIWSVATGAQQQVLEGHTLSVNSVALQGDRVVSGSWDKRVFIWSAATGALQHMLAGHTGEVTSVAVEGDCVVSGSSDRAVRISNAPRRVLEGHFGNVTSVGVEGDRVVSGSWDKTVHIWNVTTGALQHVLRAHSGPVFCVAVEGDRVVSGSKDKTVRIWDASTGALQHVLEGHSVSVNSVAVEGDRVLSRSSNHTVRIWNAISGAIQHILEGHPGWVTSTTMEDRSDQVSGMRTGYRKSTRNVAVEGGRVVSGCEKSVGIWNAATGALQHVLAGHTEEVTSVAVNGDRVVSGSNDNTVRMWNAATGALLHECDMTAVTSVAVDGDRAVYGAFKTVHIRDAATGARQHLLAGHTGEVTSVAVNGDRVVSGSKDKTVRIWNAATGALQHVLEGHADEVTSVAVEGDCVVSGSIDNTVRIWDAARGALRHVLRIHAATGALQEWSWVCSWVTSVAVEGNRVVSGSYDKTVRIWDATTGALQHVLKGHSAEVASVAVEGNRVVSKDESGEVRIWDAATMPTGRTLIKRELIRLRGQSGMGSKMPVKNGTHVHLDGGIGFTTGNAVHSAVRHGAVVVVTDTGGMVHILQVRKGRK